MLLILPVLCAAARADDQAGLEAHALVQAMYSALWDGNGKAVVALFDPKMPGYKTISNDVMQLTRLSTAFSTIEFPANTGNDQSRDLDLNWRMQIRSYNLQTATERRARVKMHLEKEDGQWRITSFSPLDFFAPVHMGAVWDLISDALTALTEVSGDPSASAARVPSRFLSAFDPKMPGFNQLRTNVMGILGEGTVESSAVMVRNEGDDRTREVELEWDLSVVDRVTKVAIFQRKGDRVTLRMERQHGNWKIVGMDPIGFLAPPAAGRK
ncbi:MAG TPA: hypothetical protein VML19_05730 [Verrucomicrobiae bacterium]|nr:hypothetical protein [Verrucomicrobiae bacterium]